MTDVRKNKQVNGQKEEWTDGKKRRKKIAQRKVGEMTRRTERILTGK